MLGHGFSVNAFVDWVIRRWFKMVQSVMASRHLNLKIRSFFRKVAQIVPTTSMNTFRMSLYEISLSHTKKAQTAFNLNKYLTVASQKILCEQIEDMLAWMTVGALRISKFRTSSINGTFFLNFILNSEIELLISNLILLSLNL